MAASKDRVTYVFKIGEALGGTEAQTYHMSLQKSIYEKIAPSLGMTETKPDKIPEGSVKLTVSTATAEIAVIPLLALTQVSVTGTTVRTAPVTIYVPRDKIEEALAPGGLLSKKVKGRNVIGLRLPRKRVVTF